MFQSTMKKFCNYGFWIAAAVSVILTVFAVPDASAQFRRERPVRVLAPGDSATFMLTNKFTSFFYGEATGQNTGRFMGFNVLTEEFLEDYALWLNGVALLRETARTTIYRDRIERVYADSILLETVSLVDSANILRIDLQIPARGNLRIFPGMSGEDRAGAFQTRYSNNGSVYEVVLAERLGADAAANAQKWTRIWAEGAPAVFSELDLTDRTRVRQQFRYPVYCPVQIEFQDVVAVSLFIGVGEKPSNVLAANGKNGQND